VPLIPSEKLHEETIKAEEIPIELDPERNRQILEMAPSRMLDEVLKFCCTY